MKLFDVLQMLGLNPKTRQISIRNCIRVVKSYFTETLLAQYNAVFNLPVSALCYGYAGDRVLFSQADVFTTSSTPSPPPILSILPESSIVSSSPSESHASKSPKYTWVKDPYWWRYYSDGVFTGIAIDKITELKITPYVPYHKMKLSEPSYIILFSPPNDSRIYHMAGYESLRKAKKIAELYYARWGAVNHNRGEPPECGFYQSENVY